MDISIHRPPKLAFHGGVETSWINVSWDGGSNIGMNFHLWPVDAPHYKTAVAAFNSSLLDRNKVLLIDAAFTPDEIKRLIDIMERRRLSTIMNNWDQTDSSILHKLKDKP